MKRIAAWLLTHSIRKAAAQRCAPPSSAKRRTRLALERLEDRVTPTVVSISSVPDAEASEGTSDVARFVVSRTGDTSAPLSVSLATSGSAQFNTDFRLLQGGLFRSTSLAFGVGESEIEVTLEARTDNIAESDETANIDLTADENSPYDLGENASASLTLHNTPDNGWPIINIESVPDATAGEAGSNSGEFILRRVGGLANSVTVGLYPVLGASAAPGSDYKLLVDGVETWVVTFAVGEEEKSVVVAVLGDVLSEGTEEAIIGIATSIASYGVGTAITASIAIEDDDDTEDEPNEEPYNIVPFGQSTDTDTVLIFAAANDNAVRIADPDSGVLRVQTTLSATNGVLTLSGLSGLTIVDGADGSASVSVQGKVDDINAALAGLSFTPTSGFAGEAVVTITTNDLGNTGSGGPKENTNTFLVRVGFYAADDEVNLSHDHVLNIPAPGVLANDSDPNGAPLTAVLVSGPTHGTLTFNPDGSFTYEPDEGYIGDDSFTYKANNGMADSNVATVLLHVTDEAPLARWDYYDVEQDHTLTVPATGVLGNDEDSDGDAITAELVTDVSHGTLALQSNGSFTYTPDTGFTGEDGFEYKAIGNGLESNIVGVLIRVKADNTAPVADADSYESSWKKPLTVPAGEGILSNDTDADGDRLIIVSHTNPEHGTLSMSPDGSFVYTPDGQFTGSVSFTYVLSDGTESTTGSVSIAVLNHAPVAGRVGAFQVTTNAPLPGVAGALLAGAFDPDGDAITVAYDPAIDGAPANGTLDFVQADGSFRYQPNTDFEGSDSFGFRISDGLLLTATTALMRVANTAEVGIWGFDNKPYDPEEHALGISNFVTTEKLPKKEDTTFNQDNDDLENFRIWVRDLAEKQSEFVTVKLQVYRNNELKKTYDGLKLDTRDQEGNFLTPWMRLVSDEQDNAASGYGDKQDDFNQTILVQLGDEIRVTYKQLEPFKIGVSRPAIEDNNEANNPWLHDIRIVKLHIVAFRNIAGTAPVATRAEIEADLRVMNERLAQSGIRVEATIDMGEKDKGVERPAGIADGYTMVQVTPQMTITSGLLAEKGTSPSEAAVISKKDVEDNTIDVFYVERIRTLSTKVYDGLQKAYAYTHVSDKTKNKANYNFIVIGDISRNSEKGQPQTLAHEILHIILDDGHDRTEPRTNLFFGEWQEWNGTKVNSAKRIGPNQQANDHVRSRNDTNTARKNSETLPNPPM